MRPTTVGQVVPDMPADSLGLQDGDIILAVGGAEVLSWAEMSKEIRRYPGETPKTPWSRKPRPISNAWKKTKAVRVATDGRNPRALQDQEEYLQQFRSSTFPERSKSQR